MCISAEGVPVRRVRQGALCGVFLSLLIALPIVVSAQSLDTGFLGRVADTSGAVVPGASVIITAQATGTTHSAQTSETGDYEVHYLAPGSYTIEVQKQGFQTERRANVALSLDQMARLHRDMPEQFAVGLKPHAVRERYYFARGPQLVNRVVDIGPTLETKIACLRACRTMMIHTMKDMMASPAGRNLHLPAVAGDETAAVNAFAKLAVERRAREVGKKYGLEYAEAFHYIGPEWFVEQDILRQPARL